MVLQVPSESIVSYICMSITLCNQLCKKQLQGSLFSFHLKCDVRVFRSGLHSLILILNYNMSAF